MKSCAILLVLVALAAASVPKTFDARTYWSNCEFQILDQGRCGSCWDFASMESFGDRLCISGEAPSGTIASVEPPLDCSSDKGCNGGWPQVAWNWVIANSDTTCTHKCNQGCQPYDLYHAGSTPKCHSKAGDQSCDDGSKWPVTYDASKYKDLKHGDISLFQQELYDNGPLQGCFTEYSNFQSFFNKEPQGIYNSTAGAHSVGGHCVKIIGWGHESGLDYWLIANSWGSSWADKGYFKFLRGKNLCNMENEMSEGFTAKQGVALAEREARGEFIPTNDLPMNQRIGGGRWLVQPEEALDSEFLVEAGNAGVELINARLGSQYTFKSVSKARTQSAAGINFEMIVLTQQGPSLKMELHRTLDLKFELIRGSKFI
jgi:cathepsin B